MTTGADLTLTQSLIENAWERRERIVPGADPSAERAIVHALEALDAGHIRVAERRDAGAWVVNEWVKKAVLLSFRLQDMKLFPNVTRQAQHWDKLALKTAAWDSTDFEKAGFRMVPPAHVRFGAYVAPGAVLMPSYVNIGARVGEDTMVDTWATIGSCAQIGARCHISGGVGIGGVLEPLQATPVIVEDDVFIGARSEVAEGVIVREGAVLSMGVFLGASTKIVDRATGAIVMGEVPAGAVVVPGTLPPTEASPAGAPSLACAVIVKRVDAQTRAKTAINELLRD